MSPTPPPSANRPPPSALSARGSRPARPTPPQSPPFLPRPAPTTAAARKRSAAIFDALGDDTRLALVTRLSDAASLSITELTEGQKISRQAITKHLMVLKRAGLVKSIRHGRERRFILELQSLDRARRYLDAVSRRWDEALDHLKPFVEAGPTRTHERRAGAEEGGNAPSTPD